MKFTGAIYNINTLYKCGKYLNSAILMCPKYAYIYEDDFPLDEAISYCLFNRIEVILSIQRIFLENELEQLIDDTLFNVMDFVVSLNSQIKWDSDPKTLIELSILIYCGKE